MNIVILIALFFSFGLEARIDKSWGIGTLPAQLSYNQERYLASTQLNLDSSGEIYFETDGEIRWIQKLPFKVTYTIREGGITSKIEGEKEAPVNNPIFLKIASVFEDVIKGDFQKTQDIFEINSSESNKITLIPTDKSIQKGIKEINIYKSKRNRRLEVNEHNGNKLTIEFRKN